MTGKDLLAGLSGIDGRFIMEAEEAAFSGVSAEEQKGRTVRLRWNKALLAAAIIALSLLLVGCAVVYMLSLHEIKMGEQLTSYDSFSYDPDTGMPVEYLGKETVNQQVLSFAGMKNTPAFQAAQEWFDFRQAYDPDGKIQQSVWGNEPEFPAEYSGYGLYTQEMKEKLDELLEKYDLKLKGAPVPFRTKKQLLRAMGIEDALNSNSKAQMRIFQAEYYENGNLDLIFFFDIPGEEGTEAVTNAFCCLYYRQKDCLISDYATVGADSDWREWNNKTESGDEVLIVRETGSDTWVFCDTGTITTTLRLENSLTDKQVELAADAIDFSLQPRLIDGYENFDDGAVAAGSEINGYSVKLKSAQTDGYSVYIIMSIAGPEGVNLDGVTAGEFDLQSANPEINGWNGGLGKIDDGDGLDNTCDVLLQRSYSTKDGSAAISKDSVLNVYFENLCKRYWDNGEQEELICDGVWTFDVTFEDSDFREIELLSHPITAKACKGWGMDGADVFEDIEVTSVKLRSLSIELISEDKFADFFSFTGASSYAVMKDGSRVEIMNKEFVEPIALDQVEYIQFADGTKLPVPAGALS